MNTFMARPFFPGSVLNNIIINPSIWIEFLDDDDDVYLVYYSGK
jgi:hypothetical protein